MFLLIQSAYIELDSIHNPKLKQINKLNQEEQAHTKSSNAKPNTESTSAQTIIDFSTATQHCCI